MQSPHSFFCVLAGLDGDASANNHITFTAPPKFLTSNRHTSKSASHWTQEPLTKIVEETDTIPAAIIKETNTMPAAIIKETNILPAAIIKETKTMPAAITNETNTILAAIIKGTNTVPAAIIKQTNTIPATRSNAPSERGSFSFPAKQENVPTSIVATQQLETNAVVCLSSFVTHVHFAMHELPWF